MKKIPLWTLLLCIMSFFTACDKQSSSLSSGTGQSSTAGSLARFVVVGNWLYTINNQTLRSYNLTDVANPKLSSEVMVGPAIETIFPYKDYLYVGSSQAMYVYSLSNPGKPAAVSGVSYVFRGRDPVVANDTIAFSTVRNFNNNGGVLNILDVRQVTNPIRRGTIAMQEPYGLGLSGKNLFVCEGKFGLKVYDITNALQTGNIQLMGQVIGMNNEVFYDVIPYNQLLLAYIQGGFSIYNIADMAKPQLLSKTTL